MPTTSNYTWELENILGAGSFGRVYKGTAIATGEVVAIKKFQFTPKSFIKREAATMELVNHENIVKFIALEKVKYELIDRNVLVMEYCAGGNLQDLIESSANGLSTYEFLGFCRNFVSAIKHLREKDLVHRDLKPSNIVISIIDGQTIYKLADFGAARILKSHERYGSLYGTYEYMHPDIFAKFYYHVLDITPPHQYFNAYHELWSLGVTIYEAATGRLPFQTVKDKYESGRPDKKRMYEMISEKPSGCICATEGEGGRIEWSRELPECALEESLKHVVAELLSGVLESSQENMWSFERFFNQSTILTSYEDSQSFVDSNQQKSAPRGTQKQKKGGPLKPGRKRRRNMHHCKYWFRKRPTRTNKPFNRQPRL